MKKIVALLTLLFIVGIGIFVIERQRATESDTTKPKVAATIFPIYDIVRTIGGDSLQYELILPPGASPHTFDASPEDLKQITGSDAVFMLGHGLDEWSTDLATSAGVENMIVVDKNIKLADFPLSDQGHDEEGEENEGTDEHPHEGIDPHYWLSATNGIQIAAQVRDELASLYPDKNDIFDSNYKTFEKSVQTVDADLKQVFEDKESKDIATFHNAWGYFARSYGLNIVTTFEEFPGESPSPAYLKSFSEKIQEYDLTAVFAEPQLSTQALQPIADDLGVTIFVIDPIGGTEGLPTYPDILLYNGLQISKSL